MPVRTIGPPERQGVVAIHADGVQSVYPHLKVAVLWGIRVNAIALLPVAPAAAQATLKNDDEECVMLRSLKSRYRGTSSVP